MRRLLIAWLLCLAATRAAAAAVPTLVQGSVEPNDRRILYVTFDAPQPAPADVMPATYWELVITTSAGTSRSSVDGAAIKTCSRLVALHGFLSRCPPGESIVEIALQLARPVPDPVRQVDILYVGQAGTAAIALSGPFDLALGRMPGPPIAAAGTDDADIYVDGKYARVADAAATFDINAYAGYMRAVASDSSRYWGRAGVYGQARAKDSPNGDPDSVLLYGVYQRVMGSGGFHGPLQSPILNVRLPGLELDRRGGQRNLIVSPVITVPLRLSSGALGPIQPGFVFPHMTVFAGAEMVKPLRSALQLDRSWRVRGLIGATLTTGLAPERPWVQSVTLKAAYQVRILSSQEVFKDPLRAPIDPATGERGGARFELGSQSRDRIEISLCYFPVRWTGLSFDYEHGSLPPVFAVAGHTFTLGITFTLKQTSYGRFSILAP
jgi:hypothetical protein